MKIVVAADHAGFELKEVLKNFLEKLNYEIEDVGSFSSERCDYPDYAAKAAKFLSKKKADYGLLVCGSGIGVCITANKFSGIRAAVMRVAEDALLSRQHNNANVACFGSRLTEPEKAKQMLELFLKTPFEGGRHVGRVEKIKKIEGLLQN